MKLLSIFNIKRYIVRVNNEFGIATFIVLANSKERACIKAIRRFKIQSCGDIRSVYTVDFKNGRFDD